MRLPAVEVRQTRPAAANLPTAAAVAATREMLGLVSSLGPEDLTVAVVTGGGSALLVAPREGVPLEEKIAVAGFLSRAGADIHELNTVRQAASIVKAGGLARACTAGRLVVLVLSDVIGDPLDVIASGPCMPIEPRPAEALAILAKYGATAAGICPRLAGLLAADPPASVRGEAGRADGSWTTPRGCRVTHLLLGTNAVAAATAAAVQRGYVVEHPESASIAGGSAEETGDRLAAAALAARTAPGGRPRAIIEGGEATVTVPADHGVGGRNQQTVLAAIESMRRRRGAWPGGTLVASIGTDGEDGPTDAAGAWSDAEIVAAIDDSRLDASRALARCDAYPLFAATGGLILTGPTGTNVADVRIVLARP